MSIGLPRFISFGDSMAAAMTLDEKIRLGMVALTGASIVFASLGLHLGPLDIIGGSGST